MTLSNRFPQAGKSIRLAAIASFVVFASFLFIGVPTAKAETYISGYLSESATWTMEGSPYVVDNLYIPPNVFLSVSAGVTVKVVGQIHVKGRLDTYGLEGNRVTFTSNNATPAPGDWAQIWFDTGSSGTFTRTDIMYGGLTCDYCAYYGANIYVDDAAVTMDDSSSSDSDKYGVRIASGTLGITGSEFSNNVLSGVRVYGGDVTVSSSEFSDDTFGSDGIYATDGSISVADSSFFGCRYPMQASGAA